MGGQDQRLRSDCREVWRWPEKLQNFWTLPYAEKLASLLFVFVGTYIGRGPPKNNTRLKHGIRLIAKFVPDESVLFIDLASA